MSTQSRSLRLASELVRSPFAWPGGYPLYAITDDGGAMCAKCCEENREEIGTTSGRDGWCVVALEPNWEDPDLVCDCCSRPIEAAYC